MKKILSPFFYLFLILLIPIGMLTGCGSDNDDNDDQPAAEYEDFVTPEVEEVLARFDIPMHKGNTPPNIEGRYFTERLKVTQSDIFFDDHLFKIVGSQEYQFFNQNETKRSVGVNSTFVYTMKAYEGITEKTKGEASFISGSGNSFTVLFHTITDHKKPDGREYKSKSLYILSGTVAKNSDGKSTALENLQLLHMLTDDYGDPYNSLIPEYSARLHVSLDDAVLK